MDKTLLTLDEVTETLAAEMTGGDTQEIRTGVFTKISKALGNQQDSREERAWTLTFVGTTPGVPKSAILAKHKEDKELPEIVFSIYCKIIQAVNGEELKAKGIDLTKLPEQEALAVMREHLKPTRAFTVDSMSSEKKTQKPRRNP